MKQTTRTVAVVLAVVLILVLAYLGGWWLTRDSTDRRARVQQQTYGRQNALVEQILDDIREAEGPNVPVNQRQAVVDQICDNAAKLTGSIELSRHAQNFVNQECE